MYSYLTAQNRTRREGHLSAQAIVMTQGAQDFINIDYDCRVAFAITNSAETQYTMLNDIKIIELSVAYQYLGIKDPLTDKINKLDLAIALLDIQEDLGKNRNRLINFIKNNVFLTRPDCVTCSNAVINCKNEHILEIFEYLITLFSFYNASHGDFISYILKFVKEQSNGKSNIFPLRIKNYISLEQTCCFAYFPDQEIMILLQSLMKTLKNLLGNYDGIDEQIKNKITNNIKLIDNNNIEVFSVDALRVSVELPEIHQRAIKGICFAYFFNEFFKTELPGYRLDNAIRSLDLNVPAVTDSSQLHVLIPCIINQVSTCKNFHKGLFDYIVRAKRSNNSAIMLNRESLRDTFLTYFNTGRGSNRYTNIQGFLSFIESIALDAEAIIPFEALFKSLKIAKEKMLSDVNKRDLELCLEKYFIPYINR